MYFMLLLFTVICVEGISSSIGSAGRAVIAQILLFGRELQDYLLQEVTALMCFIVFLCSSLRASQS